MRRRTAFCLGALLATAPSSLASAQGILPNTLPQSIIPRNPGQELPNPPPAPAPAAPASRNAAPDNHAPVLFSADEVQYDEELGLVVAKGHVELTQNDEILLADTVTYNQRTDTVTASGHVSLLQPTGDMLFAEYMELHDHFRDGFIRDARLLLADRSRMAGNTARRVAGNRTEISRGVYSPCDLCEKDPTRPPFWQLRAEEVTHDKELKIIEFRDTVMDILGLPVFYTPYFSIADTAEKRHSGFLTPLAGHSVNLGNFARLPYFLVLGPDKDFTFTPLFTSEAGNFFGGEYRQRLDIGKVDINGSVTVGSQSQVTLASGQTSAASNGLRGHLFALSEFDINQNWRAGTDIQYASDQTYLLRYKLPSPITSLNSRVYGEYFGSNSYANITGWGFRSLRAGVPTAAEPFVLPIADYVWRSDPDRLGGRLTLEENALDLYHLQSCNLTAAVLTSPNACIDMRRLSSGAVWDLPFNGAIGDKLNFSMRVRADGYQSDNLPVALAPQSGAANAAANPAFSTENAFSGRIFPQMAVTWQYPWVRRGTGYSQFIEPVAMIAVAPDKLNPTKIPNEDSQGYEFDESSLFRPNRFPGFDRVDSGQRIDYGLRAGIYGDGGGSTRLLIGQSRSAQVNPNFLPGSGLEHHESDVVGRVTVSPEPFFDLSYRFRLSHDDFRPQRQEYALGVGPNNLRLGVSYLDIKAIPDAPGLIPIRQIVGSVSAQLTRYWSTQLVAVHSFVSPGSATTSEAIYSAATITYRDECIALVTSLLQSGVRNGDVVPGTTVTVSIVFRNLGEIGSKIGTFFGPAP